MKGVVIAVNDDIITFKANKPSECENITSGLAGTLKIDYDWKVWIDLQGLYRLLIEYVLLHIQDLPASDKTLILYPISNKKVMLEKITVLLKIRTNNYKMFGDSILVTSTSDMDLKEFSNYYNQVVDYISHETELSLEQFEKDYQKERERLNKY